MPSSLQAQITRRAISPRFAIKIFLNIFWDWSGLASLDCVELLAKFDGLPVLHESRGNLSSDFRLDFIHELHGFHNTQDCSLLHKVSHVNKRLRTGIGRLVESSDDRRLNVEEILVLRLSLIHISEPTR